MFVKSGPGYAFIYLKKSCSHLAGKFPLNAHSATVLFHCPVNSIPFIYALYPFHWKHYGSHSKSTLLLCPKAGVFGAEDYWSKITAFDRHSTILDFCLTVFPHSTLALTRKAYTKRFVKLYVCWHIFRTLFSFIAHFVPLGFEKVFIISVLSRGFPAHARIVHFETPTCIFIPRTFELRFDSFTITILFF